jgi:hypothetical protein
VLVGDLADDLFQNVFERDQALHFAILVDDEGDLRLALQEGVELILHAGGIGHEPGSAAKLMMSSLAGFQPAGRVPPASPWCAARRRCSPARPSTAACGCIGLHQLFEHARGRIAGDVDRFHLGAMDHDVGDLEVAQIEHAAEHVGIALGDRAFLGCRSMVPRISSCAARMLAASSALPGVSFKSSAIR